MLDTMEAKQISELREELSKKEKELRDMLVKKDLEWTEKVEGLRSQLGKRDTEVYTRKDSVISSYDDKLAFLCSL